MSRKSFLFIFIILLSFLSANCQEVEAEFNEISKKYTFAKRFNIEMKVNLYQGSDDESPAQTLMSRAKRDNNNYYREAFSIISINNDQGFLITIDEVKKEICIEKQFGNDSDVESPLDIVTNEEISFKPVEEVGEFKVYETNSIEMHNISSIRVFVNESGFFHKIEYRYFDNEGIIFQKVEVVFLKTQLNENFDTNCFDMNTYVQGKNGEYTGIGKYKDYRIVQSY